MVTDAWPRTCLRAGQSRVAYTRVLPALCGMNSSVQIREEPPVIKLNAAGVHLNVYNASSYIHIFKLT